VATEVAPSTARPLGSGLHRTLLITAALLVFAGVATFVLADRTDDYFAWTIEPPLSAAFMGAGYWATIALVLLAARAPDWAHARIAVPSTLVFAALILVATIVHFDRFHERRPITWAWVGIYVAVPVLVAVFGLREARAAGPDPPRTNPMPGWAQAAVLGQAAVMVPLGIALFAAPEDADGLWPWPLTPLTGRVVGAYLIGLGLGAFHSFLERDWRRVLPAAATSCLFGALQLVNVARYSDTLDGGDVSAWLYVGGLVFMLVFGAVSLRRATQKSARVALGV
jgi:hypothetical protein